MVSVISEENKAPSSYDTVSMKFKQIGDKIEGTLVDKRMIEVEKFKQPGQMENKMVYELKVPAGETVVSDKVSEVLEEETRYAVWGKPDAKSALDTQMKTAALGQIVAFVCEGTKMSKYGNEMKLISVYKNPDVVDKEWLASPEANQMQTEESQGVMPDFTADEPEVAQAEPTPAAEVTEDEEPFADTLSEILALTKKLYGVKTDDEAKASAIEATDLAFIKPNYDKILAKLKTL